MLKTTNQSQTNVGSMRISREAKMEMQNVAKRQWALMTPKPEIVLSPFSELMKRKWMREMRATVLQTTMIEDSEDPRAGLLMLQHEGLTNLYQPSQQESANKRNLTVKKKLWLPEILFSSISKAIKSLEIPALRYPPSRDVQRKTCMTL